MAIDEAVETPLEFRVGASLRVQLQFDANGDRAAEVATWIHNRYEHLRCRCDAQPGLTVALDSPTPEGEFESWHAALVASLAPVDLALEVIAECFAELGLPLARMLSVHVTDS